MVKGEKEVGGNQATEAAGWGGWGSLWAAASTEVLGLVVVDFSWSDIAWKGGLQDTDCLDLFWKTWVRFLTEDKECSWTGGSSRPDSD